MKQLIALLSVLVLAGAVLIGGCGQVANVTSPPYAVDVRLYGANPNDAVADDEAIQRAVDAVGNYGKLVFPPMETGNMGYKLETGVEILRDDIEIDAGAARFTVVTPGITGLSFGKVSTVSTASDTSPVVITTATPHRLITGDYVTVVGVSGSSTANTTAGITKLTATTFSIDGTSAGGAGSGGSVIKTVRHQRAKIGTIIYRYDDDAIPSNLDAPTTPYPVNSANPDGWTDNTIGLGLINNHSGTFDVALVAGFSIGVKAHAYHADAHHTDVFAGEVRSCKTGVQIKADGASSNAGHINGWNWRGKRWGFISSDPSGGRYCLEITRTANGGAVYDHRFSGMQFESGGVSAGAPIAGVLMNSRACVFEAGWDLTDVGMFKVDMRQTTIEGRGEVFDAFSNGGNMVLMGNSVLTLADFETSGGAVPVVKLLGRNQWNLVGGDGSNPMISMRSQNAFTDKALSFRGSGGTEVGWIRSGGFFRVGTAAAQFLPGGASGPSVTSGEIANNSSTGLIEATDSSTRYSLTHCIFSCSTNASNSSASETSIIGTSNSVGSKTIPANFFDKIGRTVRIQAAGYVAAASGTQTDTLNLRIKYGSTYIGETDPISLTNSTSAKGWILDATISCRATGAGGTVVTTGTLTFPATTTGAKLSDATSGDRTSYQVANTTAFVPDSVDWTASGSLDVVAPWGTGGGTLLGITCMHATYTVER